MCITIHPPKKSILCRGTFCGNHSSKSLWISLYELATSYHWDLCPFVLAKLLQLLQVGWLVLVNSNLYVWPQNFYGFKSWLWLGHANTFKCFPLNHSSAALAVCLGSLSCWKVNLHPSFSQLWPVSQSRLLKNIPTAWSCHHHVSLWGWCSLVDVMCWVCARHSV